MPLSLNTSSLYFMSNVKKINFFFKFFCKTQQTTEFMPSRLRLLVGQLFVPHLEEASGEPLHYAPHSHSPQLDRRTHHAYRSHSFHNCGCHCSFHGYPGNCHCGSRFCLTRTLHGRCLLQESTRDMSTTTHFKQEIMNHSSKSI